MMVVGQKRNLKRTKDEISVCGKKVKYMITRAMRPGEYDNFYFVKMWKKTKRKMAVLYH